MSMIALPRNFGAALLRKRARRVSRKSEEDQLQTLDEIEQQIEGLLAAGDADGLNALWDQIRGMNALSYNVDVRMNDVVEQIVMALDQLGAG
jgi:hypothetical protein